MPVIARVVPYTHPDAALLIDELDQDMQRRYGDQDATPVDAGQFEPPHGLFLVLSDESGLIGCAGLRQLPDSDGVGEVKRMWVRVDRRRQGHASRLLGEVERAARERGFVRLQLETGTEQPESLALYEACGYHLIASYGYYADDPQSRCYAKELTPTTVG